MKVMATCRCYLTSWLITVVLVTIFATGQTANCQQRQARGLPGEPQFEAALVVNVQTLKLLEGDMPNWAEHDRIGNIYYRLAMQPYAIMDKDEFAIVMVDDFQSLSFVLGVACASHR